jgi:outer membrane biosynthesis protein TonB
LFATRHLLLVFCLCAIAHAQTASNADRVYTFDPKVVRVPVPIRTAEAEMPDQARRQQLDGLCALSLIVDKKGNPQNSRVVRCTDPIFAESSLKAVRGYKFKPATTLLDNQPVLFHMNIEISYRFEQGPNQLLLPRPHIHTGFLISPAPATSESPDSTGIYTLSHAFDPPNAIPKLQRFANAGFGRAAFMLDDGAGCIASLTLDETGQPTDAQITKCDDPSLEKPVLRSLLKSRFSPAILNGKAVPVRASIHLSCDGFETIPAP